MSVAINLFLVLLLAIIERGRTSEESTEKTGFRCIYMYAERVECTWEGDKNCGNWTFTYGKEYGNFTPYDGYRCTKQLEGREQCQQMVKTTSCYSANAPCLSDNIETFIFKLSGICGNQSVHESFSLPLNDTYLKIESARDIAVINSTIDSITTKWSLLKPPSFYEGSEVVCSLRVQSRFQKFIITTDSRRANEGQHSFDNYMMTTVVKSLRPGTSYNITVKCRPMYSVVWSDETYIETMTEYTVPLIGPSLSSSGFMTGTDYILVYFAVPSGYMEQGNVSQVNIELGSMSSNYVLSTVVETAHTLTAKLKTCWIQESRELEIKARTRNQVGWSETFTETQLFPYEGLLVPAYITVEFNQTNGKFSITQEHNTSSAVKFTYFWCIGSKNKTTGEVICKAELQWSASNRNSFNGSIAVHGHWHFGISLSSGKNSSGVKWDNCIFHNSKKDIEILALEVVTGETYLYVMIPRSYCRPHGYRPLYYNVEYSHLNDQTNRTRIPALSTTTNVTLHGLIPDTTYYLIYYEEYSYGKGPNKSKSVITLSRETHQSNASDVAVYVATTCGVLIFCSLCILLIFKYRKRIHGHFVSLFSTPEIQTLEIKNSKQCPDDSGRNYYNNEHRTGKDENNITEIHTVPIEKLEDYMKIEPGSGSSTGTTSSESSHEEASPLLLNILSHFKNADRKGAGQNNFSNNSTNVGTLQENNLKAVSQLLDRGSVTSYVVATDIRQNDTDATDTFEGSYNSGDRDAINSVSSYVRADDHVARATGYVTYGSDGVPSINGIEENSGIVVSNHGHQDNSRDTTSQIPESDMSNKEKCKSVSSFVQYDDISNVFPMHPFKYGTPPQQKGDLSYHNNQYVSNADPNRTHGGNYFPQPDYSKIHIGNVCFERNTFVESKNTAGNNTNSNASSQAYNDEPLSSYVRTENMSLLSRDDINVTDGRDPSSAYSEESVSSYVQTDGVFGSEEIYQSSTHNADSVSSYVRTEDMPVFSTDHMNVRDENDQSSKYFQDTLSSYVRTADVPVVSFDEPGKSSQNNEDCISSCVRTNDMLGFSSDGTNYITYNADNTLSYVCADDLPFFSNVNTNGSDENAQSSSCKEDQVSSYVRTADLSVISSDYANGSDVRGQSASSNEEGVLYVRTAHLSVDPCENMHDRDENAHSFTNSEEPGSSYVQTADLSVISGDYAKGSDVRDRSAARNEEDVSDVRTAHLSVDPCEAMNDRDENAHSSTSSEDHVSSYVHTYDLSVDAFYETGSSNEKD